MTMPGLSTCHRWLHNTCHVVVPLGILIALGILGFIVFDLTFSETIRQDIPMTVERARQVGCPIPLPEEATRVRFAAYHHWGRNETYLRFNADAAVCKEWVKTVLNANESNGTPDQALWQNITSPPEIKSWGELGPLSWFNISRIMVGSFSTGGPHGPEIWIDADRGIFYYRLMH